MPPSRALLTFRPPPVDSAPKQDANDAADELGREVERYRAELESARAELARAHEQLKVARQETAAAEERFEALRREMDRALDDVLASKASLRGVNNRALAISRIAEVRVQMQGAGGRGGPEVAARLRGAEALLVRADRALEEGNYGGAAYLADRASSPRPRRREPPRSAPRWGGSARPRGPRRNQLRAEPPRAR